MADRRQLEKSGPAFDPKALLAAREKTVRAVREIASEMKVGMLEEDAYEIAKSVLARLGAEKNWHRPWIRFGPNTLNSYGILSKPGVRLGPDDIFFVDIGPVWDGYEGDGGDTFATGQNPEMRRCAQDVKKIFKLVKTRWANGESTGIELYDYAAEEAQKLGWIFTTRGASGHRLSDFPHAVHYKGGMAAVDFTPSPCAWMLEIQIRHPELEFGAFYEDLLF